MPNLQKYFLDFHDKIKLSYDDNQILRDKRDIILKKLKNNLSEVFEDNEQPTPRFTHFNQGSYDLHTGIKPLDGDYDIDVGIIFDVSIEDYQDPVEVKVWVYDALDGHTKRIEVRQPCVTVFYQEKGESIYHVDLAIYSSAEKDINGRTHLAKGKINSSEEHRLWEESSPKELKNLIGNRYKEKDGNQFRRTIRYLKRWKDIRFLSNGNAAPIGIGITIAAYDWFRPNKTPDIFANDTKYHDLEALSELVKSMLEGFEYVYFEGELVERLVVKMPVEPYNDLFEKMTNIQMKDLKKNLSLLSEALTEAKNMTDPVESCKLLQKYFGKDFPVPEKSETAEARKRAFSHTSSSG